MRWFIMDYNQELVKNGADDKETKLIVQRNNEIANALKQIIPYESYDLFQEMIDNYEKLISKYSKYAYLLGFARAIYEKE